MTHNNIEPQSHPQTSQTFRRSARQALHRLKPQIAARGTEKARHLEEVEASKALTFWDVIVRLIPLWILLIVILLIEPTLPFQAIRSGLSWVGHMIPISTPAPPLAEPVFIVEGPQNTPTPGELPAPNWSLEISSVFTPEVQYWKSAIGGWSQTYRIKPNLIATLIQIESCGNPSAVSPTDARGLFQVPSADFQQGEDPFFPDTNAFRGLTTFSQMLAKANGDLGLAFAGYNGGPSIFSTSPAEWPEQTQIYQYWGSGIYDEAERDLSESPTLQEWLSKGGNSLCQSAAEALGLSSQN
jgi:hypothetical protein